MASSIASVRDRHTFRELIVISASVMLTVTLPTARDCAVGKFNNGIECVPLWEMTNSCEENLRNRAKMFLRRLDFVLPSRAQFLSFGRNCFSFRT
jgi:hypothetical protein